MQLAVLKALYSLDVKGKKRKGDGLKQKKIQVYSLKNIRTHSGKKYT